MSELNIYQRINEVRSAVEYIQKDATVQGYKAVTHDQVTAVVRPHLIAHGIAVTLSQESSDYTQVGVTKNNTPIIRYNGWYVVNFVNIDDPKDHLSVRIEAHANDQGDKAPGKCASYAVKVAILKTFNFETGEQEESRMEIAKGMEPVDENQIKELSALIKTTGADESKFLKFFKVTKVEDLRKQAFGDAKAMLEAKKGKANGITAH